jgi:co-chaperonin GroES (HSP10)
MKITPLDNYLLLKVSKVQAIGGIMMPEQHQTEDEIAEVVAWGLKVEKVWHRGDRVLCINGSGQPTTNKTLVLVREDNVIGLVKDE